MTDTLQPCTTARIPAWRLLFGGLLPLALVFYAFLPVSILILVEPVNWEAEHAARQRRGRAFPRREAPPPSTPDAVRAFIGERTEGFLLPISGAEWMNLDRDLRAALEGETQNQALLRRRQAHDRFRSERPRGFWFHPADKPFTTLLLTDGVFPGTGNTIAYIQPDPANAHRHLRIRIRRLEAFYTEAPLSVMFDNVLLFPLMLVAGAGLYLVILRPAWPRAEVWAEGTCLGCGRGVALSDAYCPACGTRIGSMPETGADLAWRVRAPVLCNPFLLRELIGVFGAVLVFAVFMAGLLYAITGFEDGRGFLMLPLVGGWIMGGILFVMVLPLLSLVGLREECTLASDHAQTQTDRSTRKAWGCLTSLGFLAGLVSGNYSVAGASLLGKRDAAGIAWSGVRAVRAYPTARVIALEDAFRPAVMLYAPDDATYRRALATARARTTQAGGTCSCERRTGCLTAKLVVLGIAVLIVWRMLVV